MKTWKLEDAKNRFSEVVRLAMDCGPQMVTRNGRDAVVIVSAKEYEKLAPSQDLIEFLQASPLAALLREGYELDIERSRDYGRDIDFD
jgi:prevent-host-death family protein